MLAEEIPVHSPCIPYPSMKLSNGHNDRILLLWGEGDVWGGESAASSNNVKTSAAVITLQQGWEMHQAQGPAHHTRFGKTYPLEELKRCWDWH